MLLVFHSLSYCLRLGIEANAKSFKWIILQLPSCQSSKLFQRFGLQVGNLASKLNELMLQPLGPTKQWKIK